MMSIDDADNDLENARRWIVTLVDEVANLVDLSESDKSTLEEFRRIFEHQRAVVD